MMFLSSSTRRSALVSLLLSWSLGVHAQTAVSAPAEAAAPAPRFDILEYEVHGNTVLPAIAIEQAVTPFLGPDRTIADVESARAALEKLYQNLGYLTVFVDLPEQRVDQGVVQLKVLEGRVQRLSVSGSRYFSQGYIREKVGEFADGQVPNFNVAQAQLALVNRTEDRRVQPVLRQGTLPGTVEVELKVTDELPFTTSVEVNNDHAQYTDDVRIQINGTYSNLFQRDHSLSLTAITAPTAPEQSSVLVLGYTVPLDSGSSVSFNGVFSNSNVETLGGNASVGSGTTLGVHYLVPLGSTAESQHSLSLGLEYKDVDETTDISVPLKYAPLSASYNGAWFGAGGRQTTATASMLAAFRKVLDRQVDCMSSDGLPLDQFACKRYGGDGGFVRFNLDVRHTEPFVSGTSLGLRLAGQFADQPLISGEQFSIGGAEQVRGYYEGEGSGDRGAMGSFEFRGPNWSSWANRQAGLGAEGEGGAQTWSLNRLAVHGFVDAGQTNTLMPLIGQQHRTPLLSTGFGVRAGARGGFEAGLDLAWPLKLTSATPDHGVRAHARARLRF